MQFLDKLRTYIKILKLRNYIRKKLAFHEAGHLVFSYLLMIPCRHISVDFYFEDKITFSGKYAQVTMNSRSQVYHILPDEIEDNLNKVKLGINAIAAHSGKTIADIEYNFNRYFVILLSGHYSQNKFSEEFCNVELEYLQDQFSRDLTQKNLMEDITRFNYLNTNLHPIILDRGKAFKTAEHMICTYLDEFEVQRAIRAIANKVKGNKQIERNYIEKILEKLDFLKYCEQEHLKVTAMIQ